MPIYIDHEYHLEFGSNTDYSKIYPALIRKYYSNKLAFMLPLLVNQDFYDELSDEERKVMHYTTLNSKQIDLQFKINPSYYEVINYKNQHSIFFRDTLILFASYTKVDIIKVNTKILNELSFKDIYASDKESGFFNYNKIDRLLYGNSRVIVKSFHSEDLEKYYSEDSDTLRILNLGKLIADNSTLKEEPGDCYFLNCHFFGFGDSNKSIKSIPADNNRVYLPISSKDKRLVYFHKNTNLLFHLIALSKKNSIKNNIVLDNLNNANRELEETRETLKEFNTEYGIKFKTAIGNASSSMKKDGVQLFGEIIIELFFALTKFKVGYEALKAIKPITKYVLKNSLIVINSIGEEITIKKFIENVIDISFKSMDTIGYIEDDKMNRGILSHYEKYDAVCDYFGKNTEKYRILLFEPNEIEQIHMILVKIYVKAFSHIHISSLHKRSTYFYERYEARGIFSDFKITDEIKKKHSEAYKICIDALKEKSPFNSDDSNNGIWLIYQKEYEYGSTVRTFSMSVKGKDIRVGLGILAWNNFSKSIVDYEFLKNNVLRIEYRLPFTTTKQSMNLSKKDVFNLLGVMSTESNSLIKNFIKSEYRPHYYPHPKE